MTKVARISIMVIIILLGLTAVAPEWLELKDMILSDFQTKDNYQDQAPTHITDQTKDFLAHKTNNAGAFLQQRIIGQAPNYTGWFSNISNGIWGIFAIFKLIIFAIFTFLLFLAMNDGLKRIYKPATILSKRIFYLTSLITSFGLTLFIWPYLGEIILSIGNILMLDYKHNN